MGYLIAWFVAITAGGLLIAACYYPFRRFRIFRWFVVALGFFWLLVPWQFEDGLFAPLYVVFGFQVFLEGDANPVAVLTFAVFGTALITSMWLIVVAVDMYFKSKAKYRDIEF